MGEQTAGRHVPPRKITLRFCPACGRNDRYTNLKTPPSRHYADGKLCEGRPVEISYERGPVE